MAAPDPWFLETVLGETRVLCTETLSEERGREGSRPDGHSLVVTNLTPGRAALSPLGYRVISS